MVEVVEDVVAAAAAFRVTGVAAAADLLTVDAEDEALVDSRTTYDDHLCDTPSDLRGLAAEPR